MEESGAAKRKLGEVVAGLEAMTYAHPAICVIGGGFTGAAAAIACLKRLEQPFASRWLSRAPHWDAVSPLAATHPLHLLNVRARDLSVHAGPEITAVPEIVQQADAAAADIALRQHSKALLSAQR
jgi:uncharacterized NAD(P)/FAD-binding protein YdhS